jgi:hypothetical protein
MNNKEKGKIYSMPNSPRTGFTDRYFRNLRFSQDKVYKPIFFDARKRNKIENEM